MAIIPLVKKVIEFATEQGVRARAWRTYVAVEFTDGDGNPLQRYAMVDTGAPFSVLPYTWWHDQTIRSQPLGSQFTRDQQPDVNALTWLGVPCQFGETQAYLLDRPTGVRSRLLSVRAKFPVSVIPSNSEKEAILGNNFLVENSITLTMRGTGEGPEGVFLVD